MQKLLLVLISTTLVISCTKNASKTSNLYQDSTTLTSITGDSADFSFSYENGKVTDILARHDDGGVYFGDSSYAPYAHLSYDSSNYIKATSMEGDYANYAYTEYFLNENKLPNKIIIHFRNNEVTDVVDFFYNTQTNSLDSVHDTYDGGLHYTNAYLQYDGKDITHEEIRYSYLNNIISVPLDYTYDKSTTNIFKTLDPLWYIYKEPFGTYNYSVSWVSANIEIFAKLFSENTFNQMKSSGYSYTDWDTLQYSFNNNGKLEKEWYSSYPEHIRQYNYGN